MRRMRDLFFYGSLFAIPAVIAAFGIRYFIHSPQKEDSDTEWVAVEPAPEIHSQQKSTSATKEVMPAAHKPLTTLEEKKKPLEPQKKKKVETLIPKASTVSTLPPLQVPPVTPVVPEASTAPPLSLCMSVEYRGKNPNSANFINDSDWSVVTTQFNEVKPLFQEWLKTHRKHFPEKTFLQMEKQLAAVKLERPPSLEEPDLAWRGIGVLVQRMPAEKVENKEYLIRIGEGWVQLAVKQPKRARFELARLIAQAWAPCELTGISVHEGWGPFLNCMGIKEEKTCEPGTYSEGGWVVSTVLADAISPPDCMIPAFQDSKQAACIKQIPSAAVLLKGISSDSHFRVLWKESRQ